MGLSLPGSRLICLSRDNLSPESFERIISPMAAWKHAEQDYQFDDQWHHQRYIINIEPKSNHPLTATLAEHGVRAKAQLKNMIERGDVVCLNDVSVLPADLFYIDDNGALICRDENAFKFSGATKIIGTFNLAVSKRDYRNFGGKPAPTSSRQLRGGGSQPETYASVRETLNSKNVGRLLAAGGVYNGNVEGFRKTAEQLGGDAPAGYDQVLNKTTKGVAIAAVSVAAGLGIGRMGAAKEVEELSAISGAAKRPLVTAELEVNGRKFIDTNQTARPPELANVNKPTLISARIEAKNIKAAEKAIAKGKPEPHPLPNGNMRDAHAEIGAIQQAHEAGIAKGADLNMTVKGLDLCDYCKGDVPAAAQAAGAKSITIDAVDSFGDPIQYYWEQGMKKMKVIK